MRYFKGLSWPVCGVLIYTVAPLLINFIGLSSQSALLLQLPALMMILAGILLSPSNGNKMYESKGMNFMFMLYMILCFIMYIRGYSLSERNASLNFNGKMYIIFGDGLYILWALMPLVVKKTFPHFSLKSIVTVGSWICIVFSFLTVFKIPSLMHNSLMLAAGMTDSANVFQYARVGEIFAPLMLCFAYMNPKRRKMMLFSYAINILVVILMARRGALAMSGLLIMFMLLLAYPKMTRMKRLTTTIGFILLFCAFIVLLSDSSIFNFLNSRGLEDTRAGVNKTLLAQMSDWEKIFGKGLNGKYYMPLRQDEFYDGWRYGCETGFLNIVLKGGYLMAFVYIYLLIIPALQGIFKSKNCFCKGGGLYILWTLIYLYPFGVLDFNLSFFFVWMWVMLCSRRVIREMSDYEIQETFFT